jgi:RNA polymerase sigma-70 factor (ECF subfamily)
MDQYRVELTGYCYRMLGSAFEAEDAVQETFIRAWRNADRYDAGRAAMRTWLYAIATNVCLDMLRSAQRRARAMDLAPAATPGDPLAPPLPEHRWVLPVPDSRVLPADPGEVAVARETIRLAFVAALQHLPPRQRAVLILRDVLCWTAAEVAALLESSVASVTSALQRARATLRAAQPPPAEPVDAALLDRYVDAFERYDVDALVALLRDDVVISMPPFTWWLRGRSNVRTALLGADGTCHGARLVVTRANGDLALGQYVPGPDGGLVPWSLVTLTVSDGLISEMSSYLDAARLFPLFGLTDEFPAAVPYHQHG